MKRNLRTLTPCIPNILDSNDSNNHELLVSRQLQGKKYFDKRSLNRNTNFKPGDLVVYRDSLVDKIWKKGQIVSTNNPRSFNLVNENGNVVNRNTRMLLHDQTRKSSVSVVPEQQYPDSRPPPVPVPRRVMSPEKPLVKPDLVLPSSKPAIQPNIPFTPRRSPRIKAQIACRERAK